MGRDEIAVPEGYEWDRQENGVLKMIRTPALLFNKDLRYEGNKVFDGDSMVYVIASQYHAYKVRKVQVTTEVQP